MKKDGGKILSLQALRALAFIAIFLSHSYNNLENFGIFGVSIFIILSGFCMMLAYEKRRVYTKLRHRISFSIKKIAKLYPLHLICIIAALFLFGFDGITTIRQLLFNIPLLQAWIPNATFSINAVAWYLSLSLFLYFMFPLIRKWIKKEKDRKNLIWIAVAIYILQTWLSYAFSLTYFSDMKWITYCWPIFRLGDFTIGCIVGHLYGTRKAKQKAIKYQTFKYTLIELATLIAILGLEYLILREVRPFSDDWRRYNVIYTPISVLTVYLFTIKAGLLTRLLTNKVTIYLGNISGYAFLIHKLLLNFIAPNIFPFLSNMPYAFRIVSAFILTIAFSVVYISADTAIRKKIANKKMVRVKRL